ncbi:MAG: hypothetical protein Q4A53_01775 [Porphyromonas sp.]|nr:hypothetical protein [Porphyromonas sp.]
MKYLYRLLRFLGVVVCLALVGYTLFYAIRQISDGSKERIMIPSKTKVRVYHADSEYIFLSTNDVLSLLPFNAKDTVAREVNAHKVESLLLANSPYISKVSAYIAPMGRAMNINITERCPLIRYYVGGQSYYIDDEGYVFANRAGASAHVPLVTGAVTKEIATGVLFPLGIFLKEHKKWREFIGAIHVVSDHELHLYPRVGDYIFVIDDLDDLEDKLSKISIFYRRILPKVGAQKYKIINLSYKDQIVCKHR